MKSFSPAGMATKAYYGLGARTFGNPDGARRGGGAYAAGGANPNGPDQGGGPIPPPPVGQVIFQMLVDATNSSGPYDQPNNTSLIDGVTTAPIPSPVGAPNLGALSANPININGLPIVVLGSVGVGPIWYYTLCLPASLTQDFWTDITFQTVAGATVTLTTATADFNGLFATPGFAIWAWPMPNTGVPPDFIATNINITVNWPTPVLTGTVAVTTGGPVVVPAGAPPYDAFFGFGLATDTSGPGADFGAVAPANLAGHPIESLWIFYVTNNPAGNPPFQSQLFEVCLRGSFAQDAFTQVAYTGANGPKSYLPVNVSGFGYQLDTNGQPTTIWQWSTSPGDPTSDFAPPLVYNVVFS